MPQPLVARPLPQARRSRRFRFSSRLPVPVSRFFPLSAGLGVVYVGRSDAAAAWPEAIT